MSLAIELVVKEALENMRYVNLNNFFLSVICTLNWMFIKDFIFGG